MTHHVFLKTDDGGSLGSPRPVVRLVLHRRSVDGALTPQRQSTYAAILGRTFRVEVRSFLHFVLRILVSVRSVRRFGFIVSDNRVTGNEIRCSFLRRRCFQLALLSRVGSWRIWWRPSRRPWIWRNQSVRNTCESDQTEREYLFSITSKSIYIIYIYNMIWYNIM